MARLKLPKKQVAKLRQQLIKCRAEDDMLTHGVGVCLRGSASDQG